MPESLGQPTIKPREHHHYLNKLAEDLVCNTCILEQCSTIIAHLLMLEVLNCANRKPCVSDFMHVHVNFLQSFAETIWKFNKQVWLENKTFKLKTQKP